MKCIVEVLTEHKEVFVGVLLTAGIFAYLVAMLIFAIYARHSFLDSIKPTCVSGNVFKCAEKASKRFWKDPHIKKIAKIYVDANNIIHFMHDKYAYEASQMALHDTAVERLMAFGIAGFSSAVDSLSAIKFAKVKPIRNEQGIAVDFETTGEFPKFGNDDDRVDSLASELVQEFFDAIDKHSQAH